RHTLRPPDSGGTVKASPTAIHPPTKPRAPRRRPPGADLADRLRELERAARPLDPGAARRRQLRAAVVASTERFLRGIETQPAYVETEDKGSGLLAVPIAAHGLPIEEVIE